MAKFEIAYRITKENEGGYSSGRGVNQYDAGGETIKGIARKRHPYWPGWIWVDKLKENIGFPQIALNNEKINRMVLEFYKEVFWDVNNLDEIEFQPIANEMFDTGVNMGTGTAAEFLQMAINYLNRDERNYSNIAVDGKIGPVTLGMVNGRNDKDANTLFNVLNILQGCRYLGIIDRNETQEVFLRGWLDRVELMKG